MNQLSQIISDDLVDFKIVNLKKRYYIKAGDTLDNFIEDYRPNFIEKSRSGFEDIINSF